MLRLEKAHKQAQVLVDKANGLLKPQVVAKPLENLDTLVYANEVSNDARQVYSKLNILSWQHEELAALEQGLAALRPMLAAQAIALIETLVDKTLSLRTKIEELKNRPYGSQNSDTSQMVEYLSKDYNKEITDCCLTDIGRITQLLGQNRTKYRSLIEISNNIRSELEAIIKDQQAAPRLLSRLNKLKTAIPSASK